jgi:hypothetical protein
MQTLQQVVNERISFLKEQINACNKPEENRTFQLQIDAIRSATAANDDIEQVDAIIAEKKALLKNTNDVYEFDRLSAELEGLVAATSNSKTLLRIREEEKQHHRASPVSSSSGYCSICGKKLKNFKSRKGTSQNPLSCWQCMILNNNNADS